MAIAFRSASSAKSVNNDTVPLVVDKPAGVVEGDVMIAFLATIQDQTTITGPSGWTQLFPTTADTTNSPHCQMTAWIKVAGSSEPSTYTFSWDVAGGAVAGIVAYSGVDPTTPVVSGEKGIQPETGTSSTTHTTPTIVTTGSRTLVSAFCDTSSSTWTGTDSERVDLARPSGAMSLFIQDTNGQVAAGSYSKVGTASVSYRQAVMAIVALNPYVAPASAGDDQTVSEGDTVNLSSTGTGTPAWTQQSGPTVSITNPNTATPSIASIPAGHFVFKVTYGASSDTVNVYATTDTSTPESVISNAGGWADQSGSTDDADLVAALADDSDATYIESPDNPSGNVGTFLAKPLAPGQTQVPYRLSASAASPARTCKVELLMGTTVIASKTETLSTTVTAGSFTLTPTQLSALTDRVTDLRFRLTAS